MANLLDRSSLVLTPTAYNNGEALCIKPDDASGDFTFSRNSAATRVNAQGLVENVQILSSNLVQNGDFSEEGVQEVSNGSFSQEGVQLVTNGDFSSDTGWTKGSGITISGGSANFTGVANANINQNAGLVTGKTYKIVFTVSNYVSGNIDYNVGGNTRQGAISENGTYTDYVVSSIGQLLYFQSDQILGFTGSIDNVSVREVGQDWSFTSGATLTDIGAKITHTPTAGSIAQLSVLTIGKQYKLTYEITESISGGLKFNSAVNSAMVTTVGVHTKYFEADGATAVFGRTSATDNDVTITNISVKEVGQNWNLGTGWEIADNIIYFNNPTGTELSQQLSTTTGKYKIKFDLDLTSGNCQTSFASPGTSTIESFTTSGTKEVIIETTSNYSKFRFVGLGNSDFSITNISVIEITDDTNLPRINYEGFSYQDALGSEQIVNGTFNDGSNWTTLGGWSIGGGSANCNGGSIMYTNGGIEVSKTYKVTYTIINYVSGNVRSIFNGSTTDGNGTTRNANGTFTELVQSTDNASGTFSFGAVAGSFNGSIDNVSVKEYLGQEVVPDSGCGSWLFESQSTNLITQSELFSDASWNKSRSTYTSDAIKSPSGLINMGYLTEDTTATNTHYMRTFLTLTDGVDYTLSVFAKAKERNIICLGDNAAAQSNTGVWFDLTNGVVLTQRSGYVGSIKDFGNGIYRCSVIYSAAAARQYADIAISLSDGVNVYTGDGTSGVYIWGAQLEQQSYATSYIPTNGEANGVTRNQDLCTNGGSLASINSTEGTLYFEFKPNSTDISVVSISDGSTSNFIQIYIPQSASSLRYRATASGVVQFNNQINTAIDLTLNHKYAIKWKLNDFSLWVDGIKINSQLIGSTPIGLNQINFYNVFGGGNKVNGKTKALAVWKEALSDSELQSLTTI